MSFLRERGRSSQRLEGVMLLNFSGVHQSLGGLVKMEILIPSAGGENLRVSKSSKLLVMQRGCSRTTSEDQGVKVLKISLKF